MGKKKREVQEVNASSTADIAFLLLVFFLVTTSMSTDKGLARRLPPPIPPDQTTESIDMNKRNVLIVLVNSNNDLMVNGDIVDVSKLRAKAKEFILNPANSATLPEKVTENIEGIGKISYTKKHVISLQNDRGTQYQQYINVQNELVAAYDEIRDEFAMQRWGKKFADLDEETQKSVQKVYPQKISEAEPKNYGGSN